ncbi:MAG TPA: IPT/TIG domain-containing protein [Bryobacteraceae bacterium]|jgi:uncharacterized protein (TIGR03437 family)
MLHTHKLIAIIAALLWAAFCCQAQNYAISTFAGQGMMLGDGGPAAAARFGSISAIAMGPRGSLYIADSAYHQVRRVDLNGNISLFAGSVVRGFSGDGGPATAASLDTPTALAVDSGGNLYIGDSGNHRIRMVTPFGNITTIAGNGQVAPSPAAAAVLPGNGGPATSVPLNTIGGMAFASNGDLIIADTGNNRVFRVSNGGNLTTIAGNATSPASLASQPALAATLNSPSGVVTDYLGNIYFAETATGVVREIDTSGKLTVLIGTGTPGSAPVASASPLSYPLLQPTALTTDGNYNVYIVEAGRVSIYSPVNIGAGTIATVRTFAGDVTQKVTSGTGDKGPALSAGMNPRGIAVGSDFSVYVADSTASLNFANRVRVIALNSATESNYIANFAGGNIPTGAGDKGRATAAQLYFPRSVALGPAGTLYVADTADNRVRAVTSDGNINAFAGSGTAGTSGDQGPAVAASLNPPVGLAVDANTNVYISDGSHVRQVNGAGIISTFAGGGSASLTQTGSLATDSKNDVFVDQLAQVSEISAADQTISTVAGNGTTGYSGDNGPATAAQIDDVAGIAVDANGNLYIADEDNGRVRKVDASGNITTIAGGGTSTSDGVQATTAMLNIPLGVALDGAGNLYIAEYGGNRVRLVDPTGNIHTIAGNGLQGFLGDGGIATNASLNGPTDVKVDGQGNVYIADSLNSAIRKLTPVATPPTPSITTITNAGSLVSGPVAPGERVILTGTGLGPHATVMFDGTAAPVLSSSMTSTLVVVPNEVSGEATSQVTVTTAGVASAPFAVRVAASAPGVYTTSGDGTGQAIAYNNDGSPNSLTPVLAGNDVGVLCTGSGLLSPSVATGVPIPATTPSPALAVSATLDGAPVPVSQAYAVPGAIGQFLVDVTVPYGNATENGASLQITVGNATTQVVSVSIQGQPDDSGSDPGSSDPGSSDPGSMLRQKSRRSSRPLPPVH